MYPVIAANFWAHLVRDIGPADQFQSQPDDRPVLAYGTTIRPLRGNDCARDIVKISPHPSTQGGLESRRTCCKKGVEELNTGGLDPSIKDVQK